jgi:hypothetical protein
VVCTVCTVCMCVNEMSSVLEACVRQPLFTSFASLPAPLPKQPDTEQTTRLILIIPFLVLLTASPRIQLVGFESKEAKASAPPN